MRVIIAIPLVLIGVGLTVEILGWFGIYVWDWTLIFWIVVIVAAVKWKAILRTLDYLFARYSVDSALDADAAGAMPVYRSENAAERSRALTEKLDADAEIAQATLRRERARAALADAEHEVEKITGRTKIARQRRKRQ